MGGLDSCREARLQQDLRDSNEVPGCHRCLSEVRQGHDTRQAVEDHSMERSLLGGLSDLARREAFDSGPFRKDQRVMEEVSYIQSFLSIEDATLYLEHHLRDYHDHEIVDAGVRYVNHQWQVYCRFRHTGASAQDSLL